MAVNSNLHIERYKAIKPFVTFKLDLRKKLTKSQKDKIRRYYNQLADRETRFTQKYQPSNAQNLRVAKETVGIRGSQWKAVPVRPIVPGSKVRVKDGRLYYQSQIGSTQIFPLDQEILVLDRDTTPPDQPAGPEDACDDAGVPREKPDNQFYQIIMDGDPAEFAIATYDELIERLEFYLMTYIPDDDEDADENGEPPYLDVGLHTFPGDAKKYRDHYAQNIIDSDNVRKGRVSAPKKKKAAPKRLKSNARRNKT